MRSIIAQNAPTVGNAQWTGRSSSSGGAGGSSSRDTFSDGTETDPRDPNHPDKKQ